MKVKTGGIPNHALYRKVKVSNESTKGSSSTRDGSLVKEVNFWSLAFDIN